MRRAARGANLAAMTRIHALTKGEWAPLPVLLAGAFMVVLDFFVVNVALPSIGTELGAGSGSLQWIVAGYGLSFAVLLIVAARLGEQFGQRRVYVLGLALFTAASAACGLAPSPGALVAARVTIRFEFASSMIGW